MFVWKMWNIMYINYWYLPICREAECSIIYDIEIHHTISISIIQFFLEYLISTQILDVFASTIDVENHVGKYTESV